MSKTDVGSFIRENKDTVKEYLETRYEIYRLKGIRTVSKTAGLLTWMIISMFLLFLVIIFGGITLGYWLSGLFNSLVLGFGLTSVFFLLLFLFLAIFRKQLFINPVIGNIISQSSEEDD